MPTHCLQQVQCPQRIHFEIRVRLAGGPIVRRLGRRVDHDFRVGGEAAEQRVDSFGIANVEVLVPIILQRSLELLPGRCGRRFGTEESCPHVVIEATTSKPSSWNRRQVSEPISPAEPVTIAILMAGYQLRSLVCPRSGPAWSWIQLSAASSGRDSRLSRCRRTTSLTNRSSASPTAFGP